MPNWHSPDMDNVVKNKNKDNEFLGGLDLATHPETHCHGVNPEVGMNSATSRQE